MSPQRVMQGTGSTGVSLLFWFAGIIYCLAGTHVYIEYGLNVPRYVINGIEQSVPRSGGDLNYVSLFSDSLTPQFSSHFPFMNSLCLSGYSIY
jgi:hypothetical protein